MKRLFWLLLLCAPAFAQTHTEVTLEDAQSITGAKTISSLNNVIAVDGTTYALTGAGLISALTACLNAATCSVVDARGVTGSQTIVSTLTVGSSGKGIALLLGTVNFSGSGSPCISVPGSSQIIGVGSNLSTFTCSGAPMVQWLGSRGAMSDVGLQTTNTASNGLVLDANAAAASVKYNRFVNVKLTGQTISTADAVVLNALNGSQLTSFNQFSGMEIVDFLNAYHLTTSGTVGATDNYIYGGQYRRTTAVSGNGVLCDSGQDNSIFGGDYSAFTTAFNLNNSACVHNTFFGATPESNTNAITVVSGAADNAFIGISTGSQPITDSGTRTVFFGNGNNALGPGGAAAQKAGAPFITVSALSGVIAVGSTPVLAGTGACATITTQAGGSWAGTFKCTGTTGASTVTITPGSTAPNGWVCSANDITHTLAGSQSAASTTAPVMSFTSVTANDVLNFSCTQY